MVEVFKRNGRKIVAAEDVKTKDSLEVMVDEILVVAGRHSNLDLAKPGRTGVKVDDKKYRAECNAHL